MISKLEWHELVCETDDPDYPEKDDELLFHIYETGDTFLGYYDKEEEAFFSRRIRLYSSKGDIDDDYSCSLVPDGLRIAWAYLNMDQISFPLFDKLEEAVVENLENKLKKFMES